MARAGGRTGAWDAWLCAGGVLLLGWALIAHGRLQPETLRLQAQQEADAALQAAGFGWARLRIADATGLLEGTAPDPQARSALAGAAPELLGPFMGLPGVFWSYEDRTALNDSLPPRPPRAPEDESDWFDDLAPPGAGPKSAGAPLGLAACGEALRRLQERRPLRFRTASVVLDAASSKAALTGLTAFAQRCPEARLVVEAPVDAELTDASARRSQAYRRATAVIAALKSRGVPAQQLRIAPVVADAPASDRVLLRIVAS